jgi:type II secretory pathway component GspD/PulD (secretin)
MSTRTPLSITVLALLAVLPAVRVQAQQPATSPVETATPAPTSPETATAQPTAPPPAPPAGALAEKPAEVDAATTVAATATPSTAAAGSVAAQPAAAAAGTAAKSKDAAGRDTLSVDFPDEDIRNILRNVADLFELNIIMPDTLQGKTTIKLRDVTWRQIFESVLQPVGYTYREEGNIIKIVSNESLAQEPVSTDVFIINYAKAADILPTIQSLVDTAAGGKIVVDARSNSLVITERPSRMNRIRPIIEQLDRATDQVMIESKFVEVTDSDVKNIGVNWSSLAAYQIGVGGLQGTVTRTRDQTGSDGFTANSGRTINDTRGTTNSNTVATTNGQNSGSTNTSTVSSANGTPTSTSSTGTTGALTNGTTTTGSNGTNTALTDTVTDAFTKVASLINNDGTSRVYDAIFSANDFSLILSALQQQQKTKVVSNPTIVTLNNTQAVINVGQERPIPSYTYNSERGVYEVSGFTYRPIGVILKVTPQVNARGYIKLVVEPEVSQSSRDANFQGASIPIVESRKANTTVSLRDGYTMGIGGLMQSNSRNGNNKVPILGSVPVLGRLFRSDAKNEETTNLIIFITAKTISAEGAPIEQVFDSSRVRQLELTREQLPGYRDGSTPFVTPAPKGKK